MAMVKKSITITEQQSNWLKTQIVNGHYGNESEVVRSMIRRQQQQDQTIAAIQAKLSEAEAAGFTDETPAQLLDAIKNGLGRHALSDKP